MIIMGIDPGTAITGWGIVKHLQGKQTYIDAGVVTTPAKEVLEKRLVTIYDDLYLLLTKFKPDACVLEKLFFNTNAKTALSVGHARGVVVLAAEKHHVPVFEYTPLQVKTAMTGYGRADKNQIQQMVKKLLNLNQIPRPDDAADALAIALTHCYSHRFS